jgi:hypothetical protein
MASKKQQQQEEQMRREDVLDDRLFEALEVLRMPTKWVIDRATGCIKTVYPVPVFKGLNVVGVSYKDNQATILPDELFDRLVTLEDEIDSIVSTAKATKVQPAKSNKQGSKRGRPCKYSEEDIKEWVELTTAGLSFGQVATIYKTNANVVSYHMNKYKKAQEVQ